MRRYFLELSYLGTGFVGWQNQPNGQSVQSVLEAALSVLLKKKAEITGCGRTDAGVHARFYVAHFDLDEGQNLPEKFLHSLNSILPRSIAVRRAAEVAPTAHARFDAFERSYEYAISLEKDPFRQQTAWIFPQARQADFEKMQAAAAVLLDFSAFAPFCKTDGGSETTTCELKSTDWFLDEKSASLTFKITANRFLRGMVRLIVGASVNAGFGKIEIDEIRAALETQTPLKKSLSVPPEGLFLTDVRYPFSF